MEHILRLLAAHGFDDVVANLHYFPEQIRERVRRRLGPWACGFATRYEAELLGTAGGVRNVRDHFGDETFLIISGDALTDIDLTALWQRHQRARAASRRWRSSGSTDPSQLGVVIVDDDGRIQGFQEKPDPAEALSDLGNCGIYVFEPEIFDYFPDTPFVDWAQDVFPALLEQDVRFYGHEIADYWNDVGLDGGVPAGQLRRAAGRSGCTSTRSSTRPGARTAWRRPGRPGSTRTRWWRAPVFVGELLRGRARACG